MEADCTNCGKPCTQCEDYWKAIVEERNERLSAAEEKVKRAREGLVAIQSQCSGHADEFSGNVARIAKEVLREIKD